MSDFSNSLYYIQTHPTAHIMKVLIKLHFSIYDVNIFKWPSFRGNETNFNLHHFKNYPLDYIFQLYNYNDFRHNHDELILLFPQFVIDNDDFRQLKEIYYMNK